jgi:hypothetical protein
MKIPKIIRFRKSKKGRQLNGQKKKDKQRSTKYAYKTKDRVTRTPLKNKKCKIENRNSVNNLGYYHQNFKYFWGTTT